jgi:site-specific recombinase XerD
LHGYLTVFLQFLGGENINISEFESKINEFLLELKYSEKAEKTLSKYKADILKFIKFAKDIKTDLTKDVTLDYKKYICGIFKTASINSYIVALNKYLKWLGLKDLTVKIIRQQQKSSLEDVISMADYKRLLRFAQKMDMEDIYFIMRILASTGIRIDELKFITAEAIKTNYIKVNNKGKERDIIVPQELCRELRKYSKSLEIKTGVLFLGRYNKNILSKSTIWRKMKKIAGIAKVSKNKVHAHSFRHLFAKEFMKKYNNVTELADLLGHKKLETTRIYTRSTSSEKRNKLDNMDF